VVARLRSRLDDDPGERTAPAVSLNHVYFGEPAYQGGPDGPPFTIEPLPVGPAATGLDPSRPDLAVLDTGLPVDWRELHPRLDGIVVPDLDNDNKLHGPDPTTLASEAGHGLFICGLVHRAAPGLVIDPGRVLDTTGAGDDASIAAELAETRARVVNLSLGGYTEDDAPPPALSNALAARGHDVVVVAAAGNNGSTRPFWPAAFKHVVAVAGYDSTGAEPVPAEFSNRGPWVDVAAPAVKLRSAYVNGVWPLLDGEEEARRFYGWAGWSGTSFAAPQVAAELAGRLSAAAGDRTARQVALEFLASLPPSPWAGFGALYGPPVDLTV
jgi:subtilisin family serine protease